MSDEKDLEKKKAAAAAKAKAEALRKKKEKEAEDKAALENKAEESQEEKKLSQEDTSKKESGEDTDLAKKKAAAAAKAKAAALARQNRKQAESDSDDAEEPAGEDEKAKAVAAAKAKAAAAAKAKKKAGGKEKEEPKEEEEPSPNQPVLDKYVKVIKEHLGEDVFDDAYINRLSKHIPTLVAKRDTYYKIAQFLKFNDQLAFDYLSELHGTDFETHMEVYVHLFSFRNKQSVALKVKIDRDQPEIESVAGLWKGANWPECEAYDLFGIKFLNHPDLKRILLGEDWVGHPMRKDYEPHDVEV